MTTPISEQKLVKGFRSLQIRVREEFRAEKEDVLKQMRKGRKVLCDPVTLGSTRQSTPPRVDYLNSPKLVAMDRSDVSHMNDSQFESVRKRAGIFGMKALQSLVVSTPAELFERVNALDAYEQGLIAHVRENLHAPAADTNPPHPKPKRLKVKPYEGKKGENLHFGFER
ncbi:hypothetical protein PInf_024599 [Phytophthora infestans]|nr:hypothetical protein PInf_024599 [Phytophthora infestans]